LFDKYGGGVTLTGSEDGSGNVHFTVRSGGVRVVVPDERDRADVDDEAFFKVDAENCGRERRDATRSLHSEFKRAGVFD
jgi:hypothetical protein